MKTGKSNVYFLKRINTLGTVQKEWDINVRILEINCQLQ